MKKGLGYYPGSYPAVVTIVKAGEILEVILLDVL